MNRSTEAARGEIFIEAVFIYKDAEGEKHRLTIEDILPTGDVRFRLHGDEDFQWVGIRDAVELVATGVWA